MAVGDGDLDATGEPFPHRMACAVCGGGFFDLVQLFSHTSPGVSVIFSAAS